MTEKVPAENIEGIVGTYRRYMLHMGRAVSAERTIYILHSQTCLEEYEDLRDCPYSIALDNTDTFDIEDEPVCLGIRNGLLYPFFRVNV